MGGGDKVFLAKGFVPVFCGCKAMGDSCCCTGENDCCCSANGKGGGVNDWPCDSPVVCLANGLVDCLFRFVLPVGIIDCLKGLVPVCCGCNI